MLSELTEITRVRFCYRAICTLSWKGSKARGAYTLFHCARAHLTDAKLAYIRFCIHSLGNIVYLLSLVGLVKSCWCGCFCVALWITREYVVALFVRICVTIFVSHAHHPSLRKTFLLKALFLTSFKTEGFIYANYVRGSLASSTCESCAVFIWSPCFEVTAWFATSEPIVLNQPPLGISNRNYILNVFILETKKNLISGCDYL